MADKLISPSFTLSINSPPPSFTASNPGFTPRSSSFPDNIDSDDEDVFDPTPVHSPSGPHYDDLPPSYDEAQQQALHDAQNGVPPLHPNHLEVNRMTLGDASSWYEIPAGAEVHAHRATAEELAREGNRTVPMQHIQSSETVPIRREAISTSNATTAASIDQASVLLSTALRFTQHEPDADARYASKLTRPVAIPQNISLPGRKDKGRTLREERRGVRRGRGDAHVPGAWPGVSTDTKLFPSEKDEEEPAQFLRAYAKALHAHSIRPAEFLDFLDGLNALCAATGCTPLDLIHASPETSNADMEIVRSYVNATNEAFFAPQGLKVSLQSFASLVEAAKIPEERGKRADALASILDPNNTPAKRAQVLHPFIEALELNISEPSMSAVTLRKMGERFKTAPPSLSTSTTHESTQAPENEKTRLEREYAERNCAAADNEDPPHSIPGEYPQSNESPRPPFGGWCGRRFGGRGTPWAPFGPGRGPFDPADHGPHGHPGFTRSGPPGFGPHGLPGFDPRGFQPRGGPNFNNNDWETLGQSIGKWGEDFGKRMEAWGDQFAKEAADWGNDFSKRADDFGQRAGGSHTRCSAGAPGASTQRGAQASASSSSMPLAAESGAAQGQETGIRRETTTSTLSHVAAELEKHASKKAARKHTCKNDDASSISSDSSSDSDSDSDDGGDEDYGEEYSKASLAFNERIREINASADASCAKGKKSPSDIERERTLAIEKAAKDKTVLEEKIEQKRTKGAIMREFRTQRRDLKREHRQAKREMRRQGLNKKRKEWKEVKKNHREKKKALRMEKNDVRRQFREARKVERSEGRGKFVVGSEHDAGESVWVVVENL